MNAAVMEPRRVTHTHTQPAGISKAAHLLISTICRPALSPRPHSARHFPTFSAVSPPGCCRRGDNPEVEGGGGGACGGHGQQIGRQPDTFPFKCPLMRPCEGSQPLLTPLSEVTSSPGRPENLENVSVFVGFLCLRDPLMERWSLFPLFFC